MNPWLNGIGILFLAAAIGWSLVAYSTLIGTSPASTQSVTGLAVSPTPIQKEIEPASKNSATLDSNIRRDANSLSESEREAILAQLMPKGIPEKYGKGLTVSFDRPEEMISRLSRLDGGWTKEPNAIRFADLDSEEQNRYLEIGMKIGCEFCCAATTLITKKGEAICGCQHSAAMRGLAKYLLKTHSADYSNEEILAELTKVKTISFPQQMVERAMRLAASGNPITIENLNLPSQVGGC